ncbi:MAG: BspA family leucine-rich repeat surface protein [Allomuricauda sp.]
MRLKKIVYSLFYVLILFSCSKEENQYTRGIPDFGPQTFEVAEDISDTELIGNVIADDPNGNPINYKMTVDNSNLFTLSSSGELSLQEGKQLDYETATQHQITVRVTDGKGEFFNIVTIKVLDVVEPPILEDQTFIVSEDISDTDLIGVVEAELFGGNFEFSIVQNDNDLFEISESGELSLAPGMSLDFETAEIHSILVSISDGVNTIEGKVDIVVTNIIDNMYEDPTSFVTTWEIIADNTLITIGTDLNYNYDYVIDWGDGTVEELVQQNPKHQFTSSGMYKIAIQGQFPAINMNNSDVTSRNSLYSIDQWGTIQWHTMESAFMGCLNMIYTASDKPNLSMVTSMATMFANAKKLNADFIDWNVDNVIDMSGLFANATNFNGDISSWNVGNVKNMSYMFNNADSFNGNINGWDVESVTKMQYMFAGASSFNGDLSEWSVVNLNNVEAMFASAKNFNGDISGWQTQNVTNMFGMFVDAHSFDRSLGDWNISDVGNMQQMLDGCGMSRESYESTLIGWSNLADNLPFMGSRTLGAAGLEYCSEDSVLSHANLINTHGWTINGDAQQCN